MSNFPSAKVGQIYRIRDEIGKGSFGVVYSGINTLTGKEVAIKMEEMTSKHPQIYREYLTYQALQGEDGFAEIYSYTQESHNNILIMERLGPSLHDLFCLCKNKFSLKTVLIIADQVLTRIEYFHSKGFIHRDLKPSNFLFGLGRSSHVLYLIDFGLSKKYRNVHTSEHIPFIEDKLILGTPRFASINASLGKEQSRRDDLEVLGYIFIYFLRGFLPWESIEDKGHIKFRRIAEQKKKITSEQLCLGLPNEFKIYMNYCRNLTFTETPDYAFLKDLFRTLFIKSNFSYDLKFDWTSMKIKDKK